MAVARFEKVSRDQFLKDAEKLGYDLNEAKEAYEKITLPKRATQKSAGYDFVSPFKVELKNGERKMIPTGIRCYMEDGYVLKVYPRSSMGLKRGIRLQNTVGIIDADYYEALNEGHIMIALCSDFDEALIEAGERFCQGIFLRFYLALEETIDTKRVGGYGSSGK